MDHGGDLDLQHRAGQEPAADLDRRAGRRDGRRGGREEGATDGAVGGQVVQVGHERADVRDVAERGAVGGEHGLDDLEDPLGFPSWRA